MTSKNALAYQDIEFIGSIKSFYSSGPDRIYKSIHCDALAKDKDTF